MHSNNHKNKVVVITGASAGLGRAIAHAFAKQGAHLLLISRNQKRLEETKKEVEAFGSKAITFSMDVANSEKFEEALQEAEKKFGPIDIWINNAMVSVLSPAIKMSPEEYKRVTEVTYLGYVYGTLTALKSMIPRNRGIIIQIGSALAYRAIPLQSAYCAAKHAVRGFTDSIRTELMHDKSDVKISMIQLPAMNTPQFNWVKNRMPRHPQPVPPIFQPEVVADAIVWASNHYRREWWIGYSTVIVIFLNKLIPGIADRYLAKTGFDSQQYNGFDDPNKINNLYETPPGNYNAHGDFDNRAINFSPLLWLNQRRLTIFIILLIVIFLFGILF